MTFCLNGSGCSYSIDTKGKSETRLTNSPYFADCWPKRLMSKSSSNNVLSLNFAISSQNSHLNRQFICFSSVSVVWVFWDHPRTKRLYRFLSPANCQQVTGELKSIAYCTVYQSLLSKRSVLVPVFSKLPANYRQIKSFSDEGLPFIVHSHPLFARFRVKNLIKSSKFHLKE